MTDAALGTSNGGGAGAANTGGGIGSGSGSTGAAVRVIGAGAAMMGGGTGRKVEIGGATATAVTIGINVGMTSGFFKSAVSLRNESAEIDLGLACAEAWTANPPKAGGMAVTGGFPCASANSDIELLFSHT